MAPENNLDEILRQIWPTPLIAVHGAESREGRHTRRGRGQGQAEVETDGAVTGFYEDVTGSRTPEPTACGGQVV